MTGPDHYDAAERLVERATTPPDLPGQAEDWLAHRDADLAAAQVHATLALAAATWDGSQIAGGFGVDGDVARPWQEAIS